MEKPGFLKLIAALTYDLLLLLAVFFFATLVILPLHEGKAFERANIFYSAYLISVSFLFYGWFWTHGGQTLGLRAWKIKLLSESKQSITWTQALIRFVTAILSWLCLGLGFFWIFLDKNRRSWHDITSKSSLFLDNSQ